MKPQASHGRDTVRINSLALTLNGSDIEAHSVAPFLVRVKWSYEPEIRPSWDEPGCPEYFAIDSVYAYGQDVLFLTEEGILITIKPHIELLDVLTKHHLSLIEEALRESWEADNDAMAESLNDSQRDYEWGI